VTLCKISRKTAKSEFGSNASSLIAVKSASTSIVEEWQKPGKKITT
jgi:hypothetical protein